MRRLLLLGVAAVVCGAWLLPRTTWAQSLQVPVPVAQGQSGFAPPNGVKVSDALTFHAGIGTEIRYDSNVFYASSSEGTTQAAILRILPSLALTTASTAPGAVARPFNFNVALNFDYREYLSPDALVREQRDVAIDSSFLLSYQAPRWRVSVFDQFVRTADPPNAAAPQSPQFDRDYNRAGADFTLLPGGGALELRLTYAYAINFYEDQPLRDVGSFNFHQINLLVKWKRFPKTAFFFEFDQQFWRYLNIDKSSNPLRVFVGMAGLITPKLQLSLKVGYGKSFYSGAAANPAPGGDPGSVAEYSSVVASAEVNFILLPTANIYVGYEHNFQDTIFANYFTQDRAYAGYRQIFGGRWLGHVRINYDRLNFQGQPTGTTPDERAENRIAVELHLDWQAKRWLYVGIGYDLWINAAPLISVVAAPGTTPVSTNPDYVKHTAYGRVTFYY